MRYVPFLQFQQMDVDYIYLWWPLSQNIQFDFVSGLVGHKAYFQLKTENVLSLRLGLGLGQVSERLVPSIKASLGLLVIFDSIR